MPLSQTRHLPPGLGSKHGQAWSFAHHVTGYVPPWAPRIHGISPAFTLNRGYAAKDSISIPSQRHHGRHGLRPRSDPANSATRQESEGAKRIIIISRSCDLSLYSCPISQFSIEFPDQSSRRSNLLGSCSPSPPFSAPVTVHVVLLVPTNHTITIKQDPFDPPSFFLPTSPWLPHRHRRQTTST